MSVWGTVPCRGCKKPIFWGVNADGVRIPLDPRPAVYRILKDNLVERDEEAMVSHFATCPQAAQFSGSKNP